MSIVIQVMCALGIPSTAIGAFVYELLYGEDDGDGSGGGAAAKSQILSAIAKALKDFNLDAFRRALEHLFMHQEQVRLWSEITVWVRERCGDGDLSTDLLIALRNHVPPFTDIYAAIDWAEGWLAKNAPPEGPTRDRRKAGPR